MNIRTLRGVLFQRAMLFQHSHELRPLLDNNARSVLGGRDGGHPPADPQAQDQQARA